MSDKASKALRRFCLDCQGGHAPSVAACKDLDCLLYAHRSAQATPAAPHYASPNQAAQEQSGPERSGPEQSGPEQSGPNQTGSNQSCPVPAMPDRTRAAPERSAPGRGTCAPCPQGQAQVGWEPDPGAANPCPPETPDRVEAGTVEAAPRVIRRFCLQCAGSRREVRECDSGDGCALWSYRFGVRPATFRRVVARRNRKRMTLTLPGLPG